MIDSPTAGGQSDLRASVRLCRRLRSKGMFIESEPDPTVPDMGSGFVWCALTLNCLGPDGSVVDRESCRAGRGCFVSG